MLSINEFDTKVQRAMNDKYYILLEKRSPRADRAKIIIIWETKYMDRSKVVAIVTGAISLALAIAYLAVVQFLDMRGEMIPAPLVEVVRVLL